jgi:hypothetical protein
MLQKVHHSFLLQTCDPKLEKKIKFNYFSLKLNTERILLSVASSYPVISAPLSLLVPQVSCAVK